MLDLFPLEIVRKIFTGLQPDDLIRASSACKVVHDLHLARLVFPIMLESYFTLTDYKNRTEQTIQNDRISMRESEIAMFHRKTRIYGVSSRRIYLQELISTIDELIDPNDKTFISSPHIYFRNVTRLPSFYRTLLRHPRNSDYPHWIINKLRRLGGDSASIDYNSDKLLQLSFRALVY